jgi:hypothetical protein
LDKERAGRLNSGCGVAGGGSKRKKDHAPAVEAHPVKRRRFAWLRVSALFLLLFVLLIGAGFLLRNHEPASLSKLLSIAPKQLRDVEIARMNLLSAGGLPGTEQLDVPACLLALDHWAERVASETERHLYKFRQAPQDYDGSEGYFRMLMLITVVQQDFGVHYNHERIREVDFTKSEDLFIHGLLGEKRAGTCVSMPVLYVAVGRRLGYPLSLVLAKQHVFARWDSRKGDERFNIEGTNQGMNRLPDDDYKTWPRPMDPSEIAAGYYLRSLTPPEELAVFLCARGHCLEDMGRTEQAREAYAEAVRFDPTKPEYTLFLRAMTGRPDHEAARGGGRLAPPHRPRDPVAELRWLDAMNRQNKAPMGPPFAPPGPLTPAPWQPPVPPPVKPPGRRPNQGENP